ncbi:MAG: hypothetical protein QM804_19455 [Propionicimonas sp.]
MSLVELVVYLAVAVLVTLGISSMFASGVSANAATKNRDAATGQAQLISTTLQVGIRNASDFTVTDNLLRARVAIGEHGLALRSLGDHANREVRLPHLEQCHRRHGDYSDWTVLADKARGTLTGDQPFAMSTDRVEIGPRYHRRRQPLCRSSPTPSRRPKERGAPATCW